MNPDNIEKAIQAEIAEEKKYAEMGMMYGSACYTDMVLAFDALEEFFEKGYSVEDALHACAVQGYDMDSFDYEMSEEEKIFAEIQQKLYGLWD